MIDLHCHILPGIDDGAADMAEALSMAEIAVRDGIKMIVATPHIGDGEAMSAEQIRERVDRFNVVLQHMAIPLGVLHGGEVASVMPLEDFAAYGLAGTRYVLLEFPHHQLPSNANHIIVSLRRQGLFPIIAHPERNSVVIQEPDLLLPLVKPGVHAQITAASLTGEMGDAARRCATHLMHLGVVRIIASDAHSADQRPPVLSEAAKVAAKIVGERKAQEMVRWNPQRVLHDQPI